MITPRRESSARDWIVDQHDPEGERRRAGAKIRSGARLLGASQLLMQAVRIGSVFVLARLVTEYEFGLVSLVTIVTTLFDRVLGDTGTSPAVVRAPILTQGLISTVFWFNVTIGATSTAFVVVMATPLAALLGERDAAGLLRVVACLAVVGSLAYMPRALHRRRGSFRALAVANISNALVTSVVSIVLAALGYGAWGLAIGNVAGAVVGVCVNWITVPWRPALIFRRDELRSISQFSANVSAANFFGFLSFAGDRFVVGRFVGVTELGFYGLANRLMRYPIQTISMTYREAVLPSLAALQSRPQDVVHVYKRTVSGIAFVLFPLCAAVAALSTPALDVALPDRWSPAADVLAIVSVAAGLQAVASTSGTLFNSRGRADLALKWQVASSTVMLTAYLIGSTQGLLGVAWAYLIGTAVLAPINLALALRLVEASVRDALAPVLSIAVAATGAGVLGRTTSSLVAANDGGSAQQLVAGGLVVAAVYLGWAALRRPAAAIDCFRLIRSRV